MSCLNVPPEIRPHAGDVEFWLIPLSNVKATIEVTASVMLETYHFGAKYQEFSLLSPNLIPNE